MAEQTAKKIYFCKTCGKSFIGWIYKNRKYCSLKCNGKNPLNHKKRGIKYLVEKKCINCGRLYFRKKTDIDNGYGMYCSHSCSSKNQIKKYNENNPNWRGGTTSINKKIRESFEYEEWRKKVFERDLYTCIFCGKVGGKLNADHIKPFALFPELRFAIDNGRTLCENCHCKYGAKVNGKGIIKEAII